MERNFNTFVKYLAHKFDKCSFQNEFIYKVGSNIESLEKFCFDFEYSKEDKTMYSFKITKYLDKVKEHIIDRMFAPYCKKTTLGDVGQEQIVYYEINRDNIDNVYESIMEVMPPREQMNHIRKVLMCPRFNYEFLDEERRAKTIYVENGFKNECDYWSYIGANTE